MAASRTVLICGAFLLTQVSGVVKLQAGQPLIYNGKVTHVTEVPWHAGIYKLLNGTYVQQCGGTLISKRVVITAGHCFWDENNSRQYNTSSYKVGLGKYHRDWYDADVGVQRMPVSGVYIHPKYRGRKRKFEHDIAVVQLKHDARLTSRVQLAYVDWNNSFENVQLANDIQGIVAGWGITEEGRASDVLKSVKLPYVDPIQCYDMLTEDLQEMVTIDKFCAGYTNHNTSLCPGDSGGGLLFRNGTSDKYYLRGVVSLSFRPASFNGLCYTQQVTGFTRISYPDTLSWIMGFPLPDLVPVRDIEIPTKISNENPTCSTNDNSALLQAVSAGHLAQVQCLIENGADPLVRDAKDMTAVDSALLQAGEWGNLDVFRFLLRHGANPVAVNSVGYAAVDMALLKAAEWSQLDTVKFLIEEHRGDPNTRHEGPKTPLMLAANGGNLDLVRYLIDQGADPVFRYKEYDRAIDTALLKAAEWGQLDTVKYLLEKGGDPQFADRHGYMAGNLALWKAAEWGRTETARLLTSEPYNVDPNVKNKDGKTALDIARGTPAGSPVASYLESLRKN